MLTNNYESIIIDELQKLLLRMPSVAYGSVAVLDGVHCSVFEKFYRLSGVNTLHELRFSTEAGFFIFFFASNNFHTLL